MPHNGPPAFESVEEMADAFEQYLETAQLREGAKGTYRRSVRRFAEWVAADPSARGIDGLAAFLNTIDAYHSALASGAVRVPVSEPRVARVALKHLLECARG